MDSSTEWSTTTIQYRLNLARALHSISPALSALHASRAATLHSEASTILHHSHCPKCGTYYFSGDHPAYPVGPSTRKKRKRAMSEHTRSLQRKCHLCGFSTDASANPSPNHFSVPIQLPSGSSILETVPTTQRTQEMGRESPPTSDILRPAGAPVLPLTGPPSQPKHRHTKTPTLKDMLSRDRQREQVVKAHKKKKEGHEGLTAFLKEL